MKNTYYALFLLLGATTLLSCEEKEAERVLPAQCLLTPESGMCAAAIPKYYYNQKTSRCEQFTWGGCAGVVPFQTLQECKDCSCEAE
jgi:Kunitz/Bovine pancreatic trypsin inhibitor domain